MFSYSHFKTPYPSSTVRRLSVQRNKHHSFKSKVINNCQPIIVKPLTIRTPQAYTIPQLHTSTWRNFYTNQIYLPRNYPWSYPLRFHTPFFQFNTYLSLQATQASLTESLNNSNAIPKHSLPEYMYQSY